MVVDESVWLQLGLPEVQQREEILNFFLGLHQLALFIGLSKNSKFY